MTSPKVRNIEVSMSLIKSWIETGLRQMKEIKDDEANVNLTFLTSADTTLLKEWEARKTVPLQLQIKEGVQIINFG